MNQRKIHYLNPQFKATYKAYCGLNSYSPEMNNDVIYVAICNSDFSILNLCEDCISHPEVQMKLLAFTEL